MQRETTLTELAAWLAQTAGSRTSGMRLLVALAGPPGAGKSTCAEQLNDRLNATGACHAAVLQMDGFHYDDAVLNERGLRPRKGSPATFDVAGLRHLLDRLKRNDEAEIAVPVFDRSLEIARAGARLIPRQVGVLIVEGNYLLLDEPPWSALKPLFDVTVKIDVPPAVLRQRLHERWQALGLAPADIVAKLESNDLPNGLLVIEKSSPADYVLRNAGATSP